MVVVIKILQVILALSILIIFHEFGHFFFSKLFGARVEKFYLFFDTPNFRIFSTKHNKFIRKHFPKIANAETDYGIGWIPLGGYCKISGMVDESMDTEVLKEDPKPYEFRTKPAWQRLLIMAGGVFNNFLFAILLYIAILAIWGESYISTSDNEIYVNELAYDMGFRNGDKVLSLDDYVPENLYMLQADLARRQTYKATVLRGADTVSIYIDQSRMSEILNDPGMFDVAVPFIIDSVAASSANASSGLAAGDRIVAVGGKHVDFLQDARPELLAYAGGVAPVSVIRDNDTLMMDLVVDTLGRVGVYTKMPPVRVHEYNVIQAVPAGCKLAWNTVTGYLKDLKLVATPSTGAYKSVGSFISIGQVFPNKWNWYQFMNILALLSVMLGVMNLIPIPGLDGGHILFTLYEMITRRKPSDKFLIIAQMIGMALLVLLMILAFGNDIGRLIK